MLGSNKHKAVLDDMTIVFWAMEPEETCEDLFSQLIWSQADQMNAEDTEAMLKKLVEDANAGYLTEQRLASMEEIHPDVDFIGSIPKFV